MNINLSEHEADWLSKLLEVHECEMSDTILGKLNEASCDENMDHLIESCGDCDPCCGGRPDQCAISPNSQYDRVRAMTEVYGKPTIVIPGGGTGGGIQ